MFVRNIRRENIPGTEVEKRFIDESIQIRKVLCTIESLKLRGETPECYAFLWWRGKKNENRKNEFIILLFLACTSEQGARRNIELLLRQNNFLSPSN